jgi:branched-chain amino acid transport system permease protein
MDVKGTHLSGSPRWLSLERIVYTIICLVLVFLPWVRTGDYIMYIFTLSCIWAVAASSLNLMLGHAGQANFGHAIFFGVGAYFTAMVMAKTGLSFWFAFVLSGVSSVILSFFIGLLTFRTRGSYYAICTLAFNIVVTLVIDRWDSFTGGAEGIWGIPSPGPIDIPYFGHITFSSVTSSYYLSFLLLVVTILVLHLVLNSFVGRSFHAVRRNERLTAAIGISVMKTKLVAFAISAFFAGLAGSLYAVIIGVIDPDISSFHLGFSWIIFCLVGGRASIVGPVLGAFILTALPQGMQVLEEYRLLFYGVILILIVRFFPRGIAGWIKIREP